MSPLHRLALTTSWKAPTSNSTAKISFVPPNSTFEYATWDLNDDGSFGDASGTNPSVTWTQLEALGIGKAGTYPIAVEYVYNNFTAITGYGTLVIKYKAPSIVLANPGTGVVGQNYTIGFSALEVGQETITGWRTHLARRHRRQPAIGRGNRHACLRGRPCPTGQ